MIKTSGIFSAISKSKPTIGLGIGKKTLKAVSPKSGKALQLGGGTTSLPSIKKPAIASNRGPASGTTGYSI